jgi:hypothetical protein
MQAIIGINLLKHELIKVIMKKRRKAVSSWGKSRGGAYG